MGAVPSGLTSIEAAARLLAHGPNRLVAPPRRPGLRMILGALSDPMAVMLAATAALYLVLGELRDGIVLLVALVPVLGVDVLLEARSRKALAELAAAVAPHARAIRDGHEISVLPETLVPGDLLVLGEGDVVHADGTMRQTNHLAIDESQLTGEAEPKHAEAGDAFYAGSIVVAGQGIGEIKTTGAATQFGNIAALVARTEGGETPLSRKIGHLVGRLGIAAGVLAVLVFSTGLVRGAGWQSSLLSAVSLAMAAIPEEFPLVFTLFLSLGAWRLARRGVLVRRLVSVETLGSTTVICTDKTGTLTLGQLHLEEHRPLAPGLSELELLEAAALACERRADDPLERAILAHCADHGVAIAALHADRELVFDHPFEPRGKHMAHVWRGPDGWRVAVKGAPEGVLEHCQITAAEREAAIAAVEELAAAGVRVLAVAGRSSVAPFSGVREEDELDLRLLGLLGFRDPLRPGAADAIAACRRAGIRVKILTGDHPLTANAIAAAVGIPGDVVTGDDLAALGTEERSRRIQSAAVFARMRPEQKHEIVDVLTRAGEVVAMTGDGINDAPALRRAAIGVSMGAHATQVARSAADLVLLHDDLGALVATIAEGRALDDNIRRAFLFLLGFHVPIIALAVVVPLLGLPLLLLPVHLVWLELVVHPLAALVFEGEPSPRDVMSAPPRDPEAPILPRRLALRSGVAGLLLTLGALGLYIVRLGQGVDVARSGALAVLILGSLTLTWAERALDQPWRRVAWPRRPRFWIVTGLILASLPGLTLIPQVARTLQLAAIAPLDLLIAVVLAIASVVWRWRG